jgi:hypothetical protein
MKAKMVIPIDLVQGTIAGGYYARVMYGKQVIQRCPVRKQAPSDKQIAARKWFTEHLSGNKWRERASGNRMVTEWYADEKVVKD